MAKKLLNIFGLLDVAAGPARISRPSFMLHPLKGDLKRVQRLVWCKRNWRVTFRFEGTAA
jgi:proteic killer suppression protein